MAPRWIPLGLLVAYMAGVAIAFEKGKAFGFSTVIGGLVGFVAVRIALPRTSHQAFVAGRYNTARRHYAALSCFIFGKRTRSALRVSQGACMLALGKLETSLTLAGSVDEEDLDDAGRAALYNNRAYALARLGRTPRAALELAERAVELRPDVAGFRHTLGLAHLSAGSLDEAIRELDQAWDKEQSASSWLEAERCYDLGIAWQRRGEPDYATDYFERASRAAPQSTWAARARAMLEDHDPLAETTLTDLV